MSSELERRGRELWLRQGRRLAERPEPLTASGCLLPASSSGSARGVHDDGDARDADGSSEEVEAVRPDAVDGEPPEER